MKLLKPVLKHIAASALAVVMGLSLVLPEPVHAQVAMRQTKGAGGEITLVYPSEQVASRQRLGAFEIDVVFGGPPAKLNGHLIVLSHGSGGSSLSDHTLARTLALAGFVVAQPEHQGDNWKDSRDTGPISWQKRPLEVSQAIDAVAADPMFASFLKLDKTGVHGMSAGGVSAITLAGGQWSFSQMLKHCRENFQAARNFCLFGARSEKEAQERMALFTAATTSGVQEASNASNPIPGTAPKLLAYKDARVIAVSAMVPVAAIFDTASLKDLSIPLAITSATADELLPPSFHSDYVLKHCNSCIALNRLEGAAHFDTLSPWPDSIAKPIAQTMPGGALGKNFDSAQRQLAFDRITQFFVQNLIKP
jgi:predicted dienelactone hydrolase